MYQDNKEVPHPSTVEIVIFWNGCHSRKWNHDCLYFYDDGKRCFINTY